MNLDYERELEAASNRPYDWQDRMVIAGGWIAVVALICILLWG